MKRSVFGFELHMVYRNYICMSSLLTEFYVTARTMYLLRQNISMSVCDFKGEIVFRNKFEFKVYILANFAQCVGVPADTLKKMNDSFFVHENCFRGKAKFSVPLVGATGFR